MFVFASASLCGPRVCRSHSACAELSQLRACSEPGLALNALLVTSFSRHFYARTSSLTTPSTPTLGTVRWVSSETYIAPHIIQPAFGNTSRAQIGGVPKSELMVMETEFMAFIHFDLWISSHTYALYVSLEQPGLDSFAHASCASADDDRYCEHLLNESLHANCDCTRYVRPRKVALNSLLFVTDPLCLGVLAPQNDPTTPPCVGKQAPRRGPAPYS